MKVVWRRKPSLALGLGLGLILAGACGGPSGTGGAGGSGGAAAGTGGVGGGAAGRGGSAAGDSGGAAGTSSAGASGAGAGGTVGGGGAGQGGGGAAGTGAGGAMSTGGRGGAAGGGAGGQGGRGGTVGSGGAAGAGATAGGSGAGGRGGTAGTGTAGAGGASGLLVPAQGALLGAFVGTGTMADLEGILGRRLAITHNFFGWTDDFTGWARTNLQAGYIPLVTWETWTNGVGFPIDDITNGVHDTMIRARAQASIAVGQKFFLRWGHEMNGNWYPWDGSHNGANAAATAKFIAAYRHIHDLFVAAGATNVLWVFSPNVDSVPGDAWNQWSNYYPGDAYVDWMAFDGYNWGTVQTGSTWRSFTSITSTIYAGLAAKGKPIMIPETASTEMGGDKAAWITAILPALKTSFPTIKAFVWFHMNKETDWRVNSSAQSQAAFVPLARDAYFNP